MKIFREVGLMKEWMCWVVFLLMMGSFFCYLNFVYWPARDQRIEEDYTHYNDVCEQKEMMFPYKSTEGFVLPKKADVVCVDSEGEWHYFTIERGVDKDD